MLLNVITILKHYCVPCSKSKVDSVLHTSIFKSMVYATSVLCYTESESMMPKSHHVHDKSKWKTMAMLIVGGNIESHYVTGGLSW